MLGDVTLLPASMGLKLDELIQDPE